jgi:XRE family aerobic/anaerobic benzoate catabolism transcriptional regulator
MPADPLLAALGRRARQLRHEQRLTLRVLADRSGLSQRFLMDIEAGRGNVSVRRLADLATALSTDVGDLLYGSAGATTSRVIALIGLRGSGKTAIGRRIARRMRVKFVELDELVEARAGLTLSEIFSLHGEDYYRRLERDTLVDILATAAPMILAVGGGLVTAPDTYALLLRQTTTVWLRARMEDYWNRVLRQGDRRPIEQHPRAREALRRLLATRTPLYARANLTVDTTGLTLAQSVERVERAIATE